MTESTFTFLVIMLAIIIIFGIAAFICEFYITYTERKYHLTQQNKVIKLETLQIKGK